MLFHSHRYTHTQIHYSEFPPKSEHKWSFSFVKVPKPEGSGRGLKGTKLDLHLNGMNLRIHRRALNGTATFYPCLFLPLWQKCYFSPTGSINKRTVCLPKNPHLQLARFHLSLRLATLWLKFPDGCLWDRGLTAGSTRPALENITGILL